MENIDILIFRPFYLPYVKCHAKSSLKSVFKAINSNELASKAYIYTSNLKTNYIVSVQLISGYRVTQLRHFGQF